ncbi:MAG: AsmA family protein [Desulfococcaceae bacterium]
MKKWAKRILIAGCIAAVLLTGAVLSIPAFFDIRQYKPQIGKQMSDALGRPVSLSGEMDISLFPRLGFSAADVSVGSPPDFAEKTFVRVKSCEVRVETLPLLSRNIIVKQIILEEPLIILEKNLDGRANWENIGNMSGETGETPAEKSGDPVMQAFAVKDLSITGGTVVWIDHAAETRKEISDLHLKIRDMSFEHPIHISFAAKADGHPISLEGSIGPLGKDRGKGRIPLDISCMAPELAEIKFSGHAENLGKSPAGELMVEIPSLYPRRITDALGIPFPLAAAPEAFGYAALKAFIKGSANEISLSEGKIGLDQSHADISFQAGNFAGPDARPRISLDMKADTIDLKPYFPQQTEKKSQKRENAEKKAPDESLLNRAEVKTSLRVGNLKASFGEFQDVHLALSGKEGKYALSLSFLKDRQPVSLKTGAGPLNKGSFPLEITLSAFSHLKAEMKGRVSNILTRPEADMNVGISPFSPRKLMADMGIPFPMKTANPQAFDNAGFSGNVKGSADSLSVSGGMLHLDQSNLQFSLQVKPVSAAPDIRFDGKLDSLDLNSWLPPASPVKERKKASDTQKASDYNLLRNISLDGKARIGRLRISKTELSDLSLKISSKNGMFKVDPLTTGLYGGNLTVKGTADFRQNTPVSEISLNADGIQISPLLRDTVNKDFLEGKTRASVSASMKGDRPEQIRQSLSGKGNLLFTDGAIRGIDLTSMVRNIDRAFETGLLSGAEKDSGRTDFSEFEILSDIRSGVVNVSRTSLVSPFLRAEGQGTADLNRESLDFRITPKFVASVTAKGDSQMHRGIMVPVLVGGTFSRPSFQPDLLGMIRQMPEDTVKEILRDPKKGISGAVDQILKPGRKKDKKEAEEGKSSGEAGKKIGDFLKKLPFGQ